MNANNPQDLERYIHRTLRSLPERRAPRTLEHRVLSAIAARAALPWYRQSFSHWPIAARAAFLALSAAIGITISQISSGHANALTGLLGDARAEATAEIGPLASAVGALAEIFSRLYHTVPPLWLYGGLALVAGCYLACLGIGATAYRTLIAKR